MSGFVFNSPNSDAVAPPASPIDEVECDGWWPPIALGAVRESVRLDTTVNPARLRDAIQLAMLDMSRELSTWRAEQVALGHASLADVPGRRQVAGETDYQILWRRGVHAIVGADLGERQLGQSASAAGVDRAEQNRLDIDVHDRNVRYAVRDFLGRPRIIAEAL